MKLPKVYQPSLYETDIYALWEKSGAFQPRPDSQPYAIVMPPPNANANLHLGYALTAALEDIIIRHRRLKGDSVLLLPGADHAGFETQSVYEKQLEKEGKSRFSLSREQMYERIFAFVELNRDNFQTQLRKMGISSDWNRMVFTLDDKIVRQAYASFKKMWSEGLIYRGERLVNYCTFHGTAFADIEVVFKETKGSLWYIRYPLIDGSGEVVVATTRPETMLGDTAVAVHPKDPRYQQLIGKTVKLPLTQREIPIISDDYVDQHYGTGAVKITPAHDPNDFDIGKRHDLPFINIITIEGKLSHDMPAAYRGLSVESGRQQIVKDLEEQGFLVKVEALTHSIGHCYKCDTVIEPLLKDQWFIDMQPLAKQAIKALKSAQIKFYPESKQQQLINYLESLRDWNISRQIAWGIPIPAFQNVDDPEDWIYDERVREEIISVNDKTYRRDPDVFDTWFSSSSWPYATLGYPDSEDYQRFYPLNLMETGGEILYPWVSRMLMLGLYVTGKVPFKAVYIHGYVMAADGSKMSKSLGNVVDPIPVIEQYGSDALRMGIISGRTAAVNRGYDPRRVEEARNFCNKLWNIARYIESILGETGRQEAKPLAPVDHWLLSTLQQTSEAIMSHLDNYRFSEAYECLYHFIWNDVADWYIEAGKTAPNKPLLAVTLEAVLALAHPFAPFVTETIWQTLAWEPESLLASRTYLKVPDYDHKQALAFGEIQSIITEVRSILSALKVAGVTLYYTDAPLITANADLIKRMARLQAVIEVQDGNGLYLTTTSYRCWLDIDSTTARAYLSKLNDKKSKQQRDIEQLTARLANKDYLHHAPSTVVEQTKTQLQQARAQLTQIEQDYERFKQ